MADNFNLCDGVAEDPVARADAAAAQATANAAVPGYSGTWLPSLTNVSNVASSQAYSTAYFTKEGGQCTFDLTIEADPIAAGLCEILISVPLAEVNPSDRQAAGVMVSNEIGGAGTVMESGNVAWNSATNELSIKWYAINLGNARIKITGRYRQIT